MTISVSLFACGETEEEVVPKEEFSSSFEILSEDKLYLTTIEKIKDKETGCYYLSSTGTKKAALTQMFVEKDGASVPYCEGGS